MGLVNEITIVNETQIPLHISLQHISPLYFANAVAPGEHVVFKTGPVWFSIVARVGTAESGYTRFDTYAAPAAVTLTCLSLGAGAIYIAGAGGMSAAAATVSARAGAIAASKGPTARRLYKLARKGQTVVSMGQVIGIGSGALLGAKAAERQTAEDAVLEQTGKKAFESGKEGVVGAQGGTADKGSWFPSWTEQRQVKEAKKVLKNLLEGSVISSHGWYMNRKRTIRLRGGPRAEVVGDLLVIETDTMTPFEVIADEEVPEDGKYESGDGTPDGNILSRWFSTMKLGKAKESDGAAPQGSVNPAAVAAEAIEGEVGKPSEKSPLAVPAVTTSPPSSAAAPASESSNLVVRDGKPQRKDSGESLFTRMRRSRAEREERSAHLSALPVGTSKAGTAPVGAAKDDGASSGSDSLFAADSAPPNLDRLATSSPLPPPDDDPAAPPSIRAVLLSMGFSEAQVDEVLKAGELPTDDKLASSDANLSPEEKELRAKVEREAQIEEALMYLFEKADRQVPFVEDGKAAMGQLATPSASSRAPSVAASGAATPSGVATPARAETPSSAAPPRTDAAAPVAEGAVASAPAAEGSAPTTPSGSGNKTPLRVVGGESITKPHILSRAKSVADSTGVTKAFNVGAGMLVSQGSKFLGADDKKKTSTTGTVAKKGKK